MVNCAAISEQDQCDAFLRDHAEIVMDLVDCDLDPNIIREWLDDNEDALVDSVSALASYFILDTIMKEDKEKNGKQNNRS